MFAGVPKQIDIYIFSQHDQISIRFVFSEKELNKRKGCKSTSFVQKFTNKKL